MSIKSKHHRQVAACWGVVAAATMLASGCGSGSESKVSLETDGSAAEAADAAREPEFVSLTLEIPTCGEFENCWRSFGFAAPGLLRLADGEGMEQFRLAPPEYDALIEIVQLPEFRAAMR